MTVRSTGHGGSGGWVAITTAAGDEAYVYETLIEIDEPAPTTGLAEAVDAD